MEATLTMFTKERPVVVWNDETGDRIEVGPDRDGLDLIEIRAYDNKGTVLSRVTMDPEVWRMLREYAE